MGFAVYADILRPDVRKNALFYDVSLVAAGTLLLALSARVSFHIGPVPITAQTLAVALIGILMGSRRGVACVAAYLAQGAMGLPVFAGGGGLPYMLGPTGGFLLGFLPAVYITGALAERGWDRRKSTTALAIALGFLPVYVLGVGYLSVFVGFRSAFVSGFCVFIAGDVLKVALATALLPMGWKRLGKDRAPL